MADFNRTTIAGRLSRILYVGAACFVISIAVSLTSITMLSNSITNFVESEYKVAVSVGQVMRGNQGMGRVLCQMGLYSLNNDQNAIKQCYNESVDYRALMESGLEDPSQIQSDAVNREAVNKCIEMTDDLPALTEQMHSLCVEGQGTKAWDLYRSEYIPTVSSIRSTVTDILETSNANAEERIAEKDRLVVFVYILNGAVGILALVTIYVLIKRNARSITEPIQQLEEASGRLRQGDLRFNVNYEGNDELGNLCANFNDACNTLALYVAEIDRFTDAINRGKLNYVSTVDFVGDFKSIGNSLDQLTISLSEDMAKIGASAEQVYSGAEQMSSVGTQLSQAAVEQAGSVQELVSTINTVSDHVDSNAATALTVRDSANELYNSITRYSDLMKRVNQSMAETRAMTDKVRGIVRNLETISFQTNTLALNAAVEAARAGDAGRGFAVIADEIRELASEANKAASDTSLLLGDMISQITATADQSQGAIGSLESIIADGNTTAVNVDKISNATNNQAAALKQVRQSIKELSQSIQGVTSTAEESAASAEELQGQMKLLNQMVDSFELRTNR